MKLARARRDHPPEHGAHAPPDDHHDHDAMLRKMRAPWLWTNATVALLGLFLIASPWTFTYRSSAMAWNDVVSGLLLAVFATAAFAPRWDFYGRWGAALVGTWLQFAKGAVDDELSDVPGMDGWLDVDWHGDRGARHRAAGRRDRPAHAAVVDAGRQPLY